MVTAKGSGFAKVVAAGTPELVARPGIPKKALNARMICHLGRGWGPATPLPVATDIAPVGDLR